MTSGLPDGLSDWAVDGARPAASAALARSRDRISSGVYARRRRSDLASTAPVAATPATPANPATFHHRMAREDRRSTLAAVPGTTLDLDSAAELTRTGDIWLFRGSSAADRAIRVTTNSPVNHVGMSVVLDDLPPLLWHAELGRSLPDMWTGTHQRGVQLHDLRAAVLQWGNRYGQRGWLRQLDTPITAAMEDGVLRAIARLDGTPFPSTSKLASRWCAGRVQNRGWRLGLGRLRRSPQQSVVAQPAAEQPTAEQPPVELATAYCAEVVAITYQLMGLLPENRVPNYYDPGRFWSGDSLDLAHGYRLGGEIGVRIPPAPATS